MRAFISPIIKLEFNYEICAKRVEIGFNSGNILYNLEFWGGRYAAVRKMSKI